MDQTDMLCAAIDKIMDYPKSREGRGSLPNKTNKAEIEANSASCLKAPPVPLYFCPSCLYVGHNYGFTTRDVRNNKVVGHTCPNDCRDDSGDDNPIELLEYDYEDDGVPNASKDEHDDALAVFHEFLGKDK